ncbi:DUF2793 domain-containing protein [Agrobacterium sp. T29]|uniref:DUF2793 domain-containing protein n=1 Tax=Agrobacterium sp. T29 TaxID=2580515 RepID=UPI001AED64C8|nr:DUF2793 domain-containing protein [Agrobacterium sp. T29]
MDRINGADTIDIGGGRRGFRDENLVTGTAGTVVTALWLNMAQEEILKVVTEAGLAPSEGDWTQLWQALQILGLASEIRSRRWLAVNSMTLSIAPGAPSAGDAYLIPTGATGIWAGNVGKIAQWTGSVWTYLTPPDGHGISLPDGRVFERIAGTYVEKLALDVQSDKWRYAVAGGTANVLTALLTPTPPAYVDGMSVNLRVVNSNTAAATLNINGLGAIPITLADGTALTGGEIPKLARFIIFNNSAVLTNPNPSTLTGIGGYQNVVSSLNTALALNNVAYAVPWATSASASQFGTIAGSVFTFTQAGRYTITGRMQISVTGTPTGQFVSSLGSIVKNNGTGGQITVCQFGDDKTLIAGTPVTSYITGSGAIDVAVGDTLILTGLEAISSGGTFSSGNIAAASMTILRTQ